MPTYMTQFAYTTEAWVALAKDPEDRTAALRRLLERVGGRLVSFYYSFGEYDGLIIYEAPDDVAAAAGILAAAAPGHLKAVKTTKLMGVDDAIEAMRRAGQIAFPGPG